MRRALRFAVPICVVLWAGIFTALYAQTSLFPLPMPIAAAAAAPDTSFITGQVLGSPYNSLDGCFGLLFQHSTPVTVTSLGRWVIAGNSGTHVLTLMNSSGTSLANCSVNTSGAPAGAYRYCALSSPVSLSANTSYYLASIEANGGDFFHLGDNLVTPVAGGSVLSAEYGTATGNNCTATPNGGANASYGPVNLKFHPSPYRQSASSSSGSIPLSPTAIGDLIWVGQLSTTVANTAPTDDKGNIYIQSFNSSVCGTGIESAPGTHKCSAYYTFDAVGGVTTVSTPSANVSTAMVFHGPTAIDQNHTIDYERVFSGGGPYLHTSSAITTTAANEVLVGWNATSAGDPLTAGTNGWNVVQSVAGAQAYSLQAAYKIVSATGSYTFTGTNVGGYNCDMQIASFR